jgi:superoxide dismutase, Cu-Zn family
MLALADDEINASLARRRGVMRHIGILAAGMAALALNAHGQEAPVTARAQFIDGKGAKVGTAALTEARSGQGVLIRAELSGLPAGTHALHIHQTGKCGAPSFESAGGHFNPLGKQHGFVSEKGAHAGDLPNIHVGADGRLTLEVLASGVTLAGSGQTSLFDADGSALVVHQGADDYKTDPAGGAGPRIACAVIEKA